MELIEIKTKIRTTTGNGPARRLRMSGQIPAVLYGPKTESVLLSVNKSDLELLFKKGGIGQVVLNRDERQRDTPLIKNRDKFFRGLAATNPDCMRWVICSLRSRMPRNAAWP